MRVQRGIGITESLTIHEAADLIEAQQSWIASLEQNARDADRMYKELEGELAEQQKRIDELLNKLDRRNEMLTESSTRWQDMQRQLAAAQAHIKVLRDALENCRLLAARYRKEEWAPHILRFCESGGSVANPLRQDDSALRELLKAERERCAKECDDHAALGASATFCAEAIRAMEDQ